MFNLPPETHPFWKILTLIVVCTFLLIFSVVNASKFDHTEMKMIAEVIIGIGAWEVAKTKLAKHDK